MTFGKFFDKIEKKNHLSQNQRKTIEATIQSPHSNCSFIQASRVKGAIYILTELFDRYLFCCFAIDVRQLRGQLVILERKKLSTRGHQHCDYEYMLI